jgi:hypothetical protein
MAICPARTGVASVRQRHGDFLGAVDDVVVGEDQPVRRDDDAGAGAFGPASIAHAGDRNVHDGGRHRVDDVDHGARI